MSNVVPYPARFAARVRRGEALPAELFGTVLRNRSGPLVALNALAVVVALVIGKDPAKADFFAQALAANLE
jgi:hypothetical protein